MSTSVTTSFVRQYEREVHEAFQRRGSFMLKTVRLKTGVVGSSTTFQVIGSGVATTKARHGSVTPMNQSHTAVQCTLADFYAGDWIDKLDELKIIHDERAAISSGGAMALGRKVDSQIITTADTTTSTAIASSGAMTRAIFLESVESLDDNDVPNDGNRFGWLTPRQWSSAMTVTEFASSDFVGEDHSYLKGAGPKTWLGVHWMVHTGLEGKGTTTAKGMLWHKSAIGYGQGAPISADITYHGDKVAHFVNHMMSGGSCLIDANGVFEIQTNDTVAMAT